MSLEPEAVSSPAIDRRQASVARADIDAVVHRVRQLIGYYSIGIGAAFPLWMAVVDAGGLILGGLWMRRN